jgi:hypothetical protein
MLHIHDMIIRKEVQPTPQQTIGHQLHAGEFSARKENLYLSRARLIRAHDCQVLAPLAPLFQNTEASQ